MLAGGWLDGHDGGGVVTDYPKRNEPNDWAEIDVIAGRHHAPYDSYFPPEWKRRLAEDDLRHWVDGPAWHFEQDRIANMPPSGDELDALVDQHPAPPEWEEEWDHG